MHAEALSLLSGFLEACPKQVGLWDAPVVNHLATNANLLHDFKTGNETARWRIYEKVKYRSFNGR